jgi:nucleoside-diphosphate-sugar epimerase
MIKKIIFSSSVSVIGTNIQSPVSEEISCSPVSPYGASKSSSENYMIAYFNSYGIPIVIARLFNVYGPGQKKLFFADIIKKLEINKDEVELWGGGNQIRDYLHIDDVIDGLIFLAQNGKKGEIYNLSSGIPVKLIDLTLLIAKHFTNSIPNIVSTKTFKGDISGWYGCTKKIQDLGFYPKVKLDQGVSKSVKWYHENKDWYK